MKREQSNERRNPKKSTNKAQKTPLIDEPSSGSEVEEEDCGMHSQCLQINKNKLKIVKIN